MLSRLTLKSQLFAAFGVVLIAMVALTGYQISAAMTTDASLDGLYQDTYVPTAVAGEIRGHFALAMMDVRRLTDDQDDDARAVIVTSLTGNIAAIDEDLPILQEAIAVEEEAALVQDFTTAYTTQRANWTTILNAGTDQRAAATEAVMDTAYRGNYAAVNGAMAAILESERTHALSFYESATATADSARTASLIASLLVVLGALTIAWFVARRVSGQVGTSARSVSKRAAGLTRMSARLSSSAEGTAEQANAAAAAAEQVSASVQTVAAAVEEMGAAVNEIAQNTSRASEIASRAVEVADRTSGTVTKLSASSNEISAVIDVITTIAAQTNLLALNATIEAARAGEAGRGFAVVASEVQDLARATAKATEEIAASIAGIQADSGDAISAIGEISEIIGQINDIQSTIATAVEEQAASNNEISRSVAEAAEGTRAIAENITLVASAADSTTEAAASTNTTAGELTGLASTLQAIVDRRAAQPDEHGDNGSHDYQVTPVNRAPVVPQSEDDLSRGNRAELARTLAAYGSRDTYDTAGR